MLMVTYVVAVLLLTHASFFRHDSDAAVGVSIPLVPSVSSFTTRTARHSRAGDSDVLAATNGINPSYGLTVTAEVENPPTKVKLLVDTGADITTLLCDSTCPGCYPSGAPNFHPSGSGSFQMLTHCDKSACDGLGLPTPCGQNTSKCEYIMRLGYSGKNTSSILAKGPFGIQAGNTTLKLANVFVGCATSDPGRLPGDAAGVLALGQHNYSFISTFVREEKTLPVFSTCVGGPLDKRPGRLVVGEDVIKTSTNGVVTLPLKSRTGFGARYVVALRGIALQGEVFTDHTVGGDMVIDTGTPFLMLGSSMYDPFVTALDGYLGSPAQLQDPANTTLRCYHGVGSMLALPAARLSFEEGQIALQNSGLFLDDAANNVTCLAVLRTTGSYSVFGSLPQANIRVQYDLQTQQMSFFPDNCSAA